MKIQELYRRTSDERKYLAQFVRLRDMKSGHLKDGSGFVAVHAQSMKRIDKHGFLVPVPASERKTYVSAIVFTDKKLNVKVGCSCLDNLFRWEVANHDKGAADIYYSNGQAPNSTNPLLKVSLCKHLAALYLKIAHRIPK